MKLFCYRNLPLCLYWGLSLLVFGSLVLGPISYRGLDYFVLFAFLGPFFGLFSLGYLVGARANFTITVQHRLSAARRCFSGHRRLLTYLLVWAVVSSLISWIRLLQTGASLNFSAIGQSYLDGYSGYERGSASIDATYVFDIFDQTIVNLALIIGIANYAWLGQQRKVMLLFAIASYLLVNVLGGGKQKYLGDIIIFLGSAWLIDAARRNRRIRVKTIVLVAVANFAAVAAFCEILRQRYVAAGIGVLNIGSKSSSLMSWDVNSVIFNWFGVEYGFAIGVFLSYFSNGLYGLYLSLTLPFVWTYGLGSSYSLGRVAEIILHKDGAILTGTYPFRVGEVYGWGLSKWHSVFAWLASDLSFAGVLVFTPFFAALYARVWRESVNSTNRYASPLFIYLTLGLMFSFANNQLAHSMQGVLVLLFLTVQWWRHRERRSRGRREGVPYTCEAKESEHGLSI